MNDEDRARLLRHLMAKMMHDLTREEGSLVITPDEEAFLMERGLAYRCGNCIALHPSEGQTFEDLEQAVRRERVRKTFGFQ